MKTILLYKQLNVTYKLVEVKKDKEYIVTKESKVYNYKSIVAKCENFGNARKEFRNRIINII